MQFHFSIQQVFFAESAITLYIKSTSSIMCSRVQQGRPAEPQDKQTNNYHIYSTVNLHESTYSKHTDWDPINLDHSFRTSITVWRIYCRLWEGVWYRLPLSIHNHESLMTRCDAIHRHRHPSGLGCRKSAPEPARGRKSASESARGHKSSPESARGRKSNGESVSQVPITNKIFYTEWCDLQTQIYTSNILHSRKYRLENVYDDKTLLYNHATFVRLNFTCYIISGNFPHIKICCIQSYQ